MKCVNRSSKDFKFLAQHYDVSVGTLEYITHKYWQETGSEDYFPSEIYIKKQIGKGQYEEHNKDVKDLWESSYSTPQEFQSREALESAYEKALKFFPEEAVSFYENFKGNYVLTVKKPVAKVKPSINDYSNRKSFDAQELADFNLVTNGDYRTTTEQMAVDEEGRPVEPIEREIVREQLQHMENMLLPVRYRDSFDTYFKEHPDSFIQQALEEQREIQDINDDNSEKNSNFAAKLNNSKHERRQILSERFTQEELRACSGILEETEALLQRGDESSVPETKTEKTGDIKLGKKQETVLEDWAKKHNVWIENTTETLSKQYGNPFAEEGEAVVYSKDGSTVVKAINLAYYIEPHLMLDRIVLHNRVAPDTALTLTHFGRNSNGEFVVVAEQPFVEGEKPSQQEIINFMASLGFRPYNKRGTDFINDKEGIIADDLHDENVIKTSNNAFLIIDGDFRINAKNYGLNGKRTTKSEGIQAMQTPDGTLYGFVGMDGNIYLDEDIIRPEHPIHEYTHLWDRIIAKKNPELWKRGITLMRQTSLWDEYANSEQYGKKWKATKGMTDEKFDALVASEVHARLTGKEGERLLKEEAKKKGAKGVIGRLRNWLLEVFKELKATFSDWSKEEINKLTLDDFVNMTVRDFFDGVNFRERNGKQEFTFKDGITVTAPFSPNFQQVDALNFMSDFVNSHETSMTLAGYAGTGKTSIMEMLAQKMRKQGKQVMFTATTNQAARVLGERIKKSGFETTTLHKAFGINVKVDEEQAYDERNTKQEASGKVRMLPGATVIIDESSMIDEKSYKTINDIARQNGLKIIYVGDPAQLPPVGEDKISIVFRENNGNMRTLTIVERTGDNAILKEATNLRSGKPLSGESDFNKDGKGVAYISQSNKEELRKIVEKFAPELKDNPNLFRILAFTNKAVTKYNEAVRAAMGYTDETPRVNEPIVGYNNWGEEYDPYTKETKYRFINSGSYRIIKVNPKTTVTYHKPLADGTIAELEASPIVIEDSQGKTQELNLIDIKHNPRNLQTAIQLAKEKDRLAKEASIAWKARQIQQFAMLKGQMRDIEKFLFVNDVIAIPDNRSKDGKRVLQKKVFDYGYAMTVHKSQGSTFTHVMMDDIDISTAKNQGKRDNNPFMGTPIELEDSNTEGVSMNNTDFGEVADFFGEGIEAESNEIQKEASDDADLRQQLRYVAVSRATDTVTIISNNIKSEDSPLNHMGRKESSDNTQDANSQQSAQPKPQVRKEEIVSDSEKVSDAASTETAKQVEQKLEEAEPSDELRVSLPGYEYFKEIPESITVDEAWKVDRLKELDKMLSNENTPQQNDEILLRMDKVIDALDEETYYGNTSKQKTAVLEKKLGTLGEINKQIRRVQESNRLPQSEVAHIAELAMNAVSDMVSDIQKNPELVKQWFPMVKTEKDFKTATRKEIIETITLDRLLDRVKEMFNSEEVDFDPSTGLQADVIYDNFMGIVQFGINVFSMNEGFGLKKNYRNDSYEITESSHLSTDDFNTPQDTATVEELEGDEQEHWQIEQRTLEVLNSATELVRMAIHNCYKVDMQGNPIESKWHIKERMNPHDAVYSILAWTRGSLTLPDMISKLSEKQKSHKWLGQLVERLRDTSGNEADFQSQFFNTMCKSRQRYSITQLVDGRFIARPVNEHPSSTVAMNSIKAQFNMGEYPLFIDENGNRGKVNEKMLGSNKTVDSDTFNLHKGLSELKELTDALDKGTELSEEMKQKAQDNIQAVCTVIGFYPETETINEAMTPENIKTMTDKLGFLVADLDKMLSEQKANPGIAPFKPFEYKGANDISGTIGNFIKPITELMDEVDPNMVYEDGKMYQQYVTPSYLSLLIEKFHGDSDYVRSFMDREYGQSQWFKTKKQGWRLDWLERLASDQKSRDIFAHTVELNFNKHRYMKNMTPEEYTLSMLAGYGFGSIDKDSTMVPSWYRVPIQSNKPSNEYIRFWSYRGDNYKETILNGGYNAKTQGKVRPGGIYAIYLQELSRIDTVRKRNKKKGDAGFIKNFDTLGREFCYLPFLNAYLRDSKGGIILKDAEGNVSDNNAELARLLQQKVAAEKALTADEEARLMTLVQDAIRTHLEEKTQSILEGWERKGILEAAKSIEGMSNKDEEVRASLENFIWNDHFAVLNILEMTIGDIACYKDAEDLQKRLAQLHAPGIRANIYATDYKGNRVSDGVYRTLVLKDFDSFVSNLIANLNEMFDRKIASAPDTAAREYWKNLKHRLTRPRTYNEDGSVKDQGGDYWNINVADAQGFSSPASYRKKALMFGRWSKKAEDIYQRLLKGEYRFDDLDTAFQPLKPFVYAQLHKNMGVDNAPIQIMPIPFQAKNAEYLLIMADAMLQGEHTSRPNLLRAIYRIMQDSEERFPTKGIDTVQFESAIKSGLQTPIDLNQFLDREAGEEGAYTLLHNLMYRTDDKGNLVYNIDSYVYEAPYENYCLQQEIPAHFKNHQQSQGSQERMIIPSDLEFADQEKARQYRSEIESITAENINLSVEEFRDELKLDSGDKRLKNLALSELLQREILDSSRYGVDMFLACGINENTGDFVIPKGDPIQAKRVEQLINSLIKKRINNQEIAGGPIVQVSNWGTSRQLHIRFHTKNGGILMTEEEYKQKHPDKSYADYVRKNQAGVAYYEVFAPIWAKDIFKKFADKDGIIDVGAIELLAPELLKMISYRIPTEDKYSIAPMKLMGFLPKEAGDGIMFPYELTGIDDSDFDVDKRYVMLWDYQIASRVEPKENESMTDAEKSYIQNNRKSIVNELAKAINLTAKASASEIEEIEKEVNAEAESKVKTATRIHNERLRAIERRNSMAEDAIDNTEFSKNEEKNEEIYDKKVEKLEKQYDKAVAREEQNYQEKLANIEQEKIDNLSNKVSELERQKVRDRIIRFLDEDRFENSSHDDALTRAIRKAYLNYMYKVVPNPDKRAQNNNKILDLTWDVLTDESMAHQLLNPGGFEDWKNAGYKIAAYKANPYATWEELGELENGDLSKMFKQQHDLTFVDAQIQFYKQNAAAASLLGIFAVNKIAHATLEADHLLIAVDEFCSGVDENHPIRIAGFTFGGYRDKDGKPLMSLSEFKEAKKEQPEVYEHMEYGDYLTLNADPRFTNRMFIDPRYDKNGKLVGKTLGSGVGASADAAKDPFLDLINVNLSTINVMTTMLRLGMPFEDAALFLSQGVLSEVLEEFNKENLTGWTSLSSIISAKLADIAERNNIGEDAPIESEELSKEELIRGLRDADRREETDYKVLKTFQRLQALAEGMRNPTFATRFNSVSSAVGPLIIDNLILENKRDNFKLGKRDSTGFYTVEGDVVDIEYIFKLHPILKAFAQTLDIAEEMFRDMPAGSTGFRNLLKKLPDGIKYKIFSNKDLFNDLSNFYQSHMLINAGMVDPSKLKYYIEEFPKKFVSNKYKEKYRDNPFIKAVSFTTSSKTGRTFLNVDVVGKSQPEKDVYSSGLVDLYKENPELALDLFNYFFFRGGINFTPKTAMGLFPTYVKEHLSTTKEDGDKVSYIDVYRRMLSASPEIIIDQFLRNNWNEGRLVPKFKGKSEITYENKKPVRLIISNPEDVQNMADVLYMKTTIDKKTYLWKLMGDANDAENSSRLVFEVTTPLGDNSEYLEMDVKNIEKPMSDTALDIEDTNSTELQAEGPANPDGAINDAIIEQIDLDGDKFRNALLAWRKSSDPSYTQEKADALNNTIKTNPEKFGNIIKAVFDSMGIRRSEKEAVEFYKKLC